MSKKILIVEDESVIAFDLELILCKARYEVCGIADSVHEALGLIEHSRPDMVLLDIQLKGSLTGIDLARNLTKSNIPFVYLSAYFHTEILELAKTTEAYGFLVKPFREEDLLIALDVAFYRAQNSWESSIRQEQSFEQQVSEITGSQASPELKSLQLLSSIQPHIPFDFVALTFKTDRGAALGEASYLRVGLNEYQMIGKQEFLSVNRLTEDRLTALLETGPFFCQSDFVNYSEIHSKLSAYPILKIITDTFKLKSFLTQSLLTTNGDVFSVTFFSRKAEGYSEKNMNFIKRVQQTLTIAIEQAFFGNFSAKEIPSPAAQDGLNMNPERHVFDGIIGTTHQMLRMQDLVSLVAPLDTSVLILGESGTGKERIAKSIHELSPRHKKQMVIVNCASLPANLVESELFGHEKGAFTGAFEKRIGKFELADNGTIFLDEIGELTMELQMKLLRVLQEQEIERIGGRNTIKVNLRIIAATNKNLQKEVEEGRFRLDLFYRLYVFPITIPPLRERRDDIVLLAKHFVRHFSRKNGKIISGLSNAVIEKLTNYGWPGNVRELEHLIERSMLMATGTTIEQINLPGEDTASFASDFATSPLKTIDENSRDYIISVLKKCKGKISGNGGAAELLELQANTLHSKLKRLQIAREDYEI